MMTPRERLRAALQHQEPDRVPIDLGSMHTSIETYAYEPLKQFLKVGLSKPMKTFVRDHVEPDEEILELFSVDTRYLRIGPPDGWKLQMEPDNSFVDEWGTRWNKPQGSLYFDPVGFPLENATLNDLDSYRWPDPRDPGRTRGLRERAKGLYEETDYALCADTADTCWARATTSRPTFRRRISLPCIRPPGNWAATPCGVDQRSRGMCPTVSAHSG